MKLQDFLDVASRLPLVDDNGTVRVLRNGKNVSLIRGVAYACGQHAYDDIEAGAKIGLKHGLINTIQKAAEDAPGCNSGLRGRLRGVAMLDLSELAGVV